MGSEVLESKTNAPQEVYRVITYKAQELPPEFKNLIIAPFLNSLRYGNDLFKLIDKNSYYLHYGKYVECLLSRPSCDIQMAILADNTVLGWSIFDNRSVHYVWVKKEVRRQGIAKSLLPKDFDTISHITNTGINIWVNKFPNVGFNPWS